MGRGLVQQPKACWGARGGRRNLRVEEKLWEEAPPPWEEKGRLARTRNLLRGRRPHSLLDQARKITPRSLWPRLPSSSKSSRMLSKGFDVAGVGAGGKVDAHVVDHGCQECA